MKESENIEVHGHSFVIKWINLLEYIDNKTLDSSSSPIVNFNFTVRPAKKNIKFGLFTKKHGLNSAGNTFDSVNNIGNSNGRSYRNIFRHANTSLSSIGSTSNGKNSNSNSNNNIHNGSFSSSTPPLHRSSTSASITTPASIKKEKKISLKEKLNKSNMDNLLPLEEIKNNKNFTKNVTISLDQPLYIALVFDNENNLRKNKVELSFEITTSNVELNSGSNPSLATYFKNGMAKQNGDTGSIANEGSAIQVQGATSLTNKENVENAYFSFIQPGQISPPGSTPKPLLRARRESLAGLSKRSFYIENNTIFQGYVPKNRRNPKSNKQFVTRFFLLDMRSGTLTYYQNNNTKNVKGEVLLKTCIVSADAQRGEIVIDSGFEIWILKPYSWDYDPWVDALGKCIIEESLLEQEKNENSVIVADEDILSVKKSLAQIERLTYEAKSLAKNEKLISILDNILEIAMDPEKFNMKKSRSAAKASSESLNADVYSSLSMDEFYDAIDEIPRVIMINSVLDESDLHDKEEEEEEEEEEDDDDEEETEDEEEDGEEEESEGTTFSPTLSSALKPSITPEETENEYPLPHSPVKRRNDVAASTKSPPSLLSFLRKNVGKDLGSISMPVTSNEPLTILQFLAESLEYASLLNDCLDTIALESYSSIESQRQRLALVSAFAISQLSQQRSKVRCSRKPFNPLLGETFELVNEIENYRSIAEKVEHKPEQVFAIFSQGFGNPSSKSSNTFKWEISYTVQPSSKFWGKSIELMNYGTAYLKFINKSTNSVIETYTWTAPVTILKNLLAGEKFVEPTGDVEVACLESKLKTVFSFKPAGGFFKGRTEETNGKIIGTDGKNIGTLQGTWTKELYLLPENEKIWEVGSLVPNAESKYGFSKFGSNLNEITEIEKDSIPKSDSRFRPDVRFYENGDLDKAEEYKLKLEQDQRDRRLNKKDVKPLYFKKKNSSEYAFVKGIDSYWSKRERKDWSNAPTLW